MEVIYECCCGLDVHKKVIVACIVNKSKRVVKTFGSMTDDILQLVQWIKVNQCEMVAMESTGVFWKPIYNLFELHSIPIIVVNAKHMKAVPGRKTDVKDSEWIADLLKHGLLHASYIPSKSQRELRELVRYRRSIIEERSREISRIQKILEGANIKLSSVATNVLGVTGRAIIEKLVSGDLDDEDIEKLAKKALKKKLPQLKRAVNGLMGEHQKILLSIQLEHYDFLEDQIKKLSVEIQNRLKYSEAEIELIDSIPGVGRTSAEEIIAEIGTDMSRFPSKSNISSWAGLCPGNNESAGKKKRGKAREGNKYLKASLVECAWSNSRMKKTYFYSLYHRIASRKGNNRASIAVAHSMLIVIYQMLKEKKSYIELGSDYFDNLDKKVRVEKLTKKIEALGYSVTIQEASV